MSFKAPLGRHHPQKASALSPEVSKLSLLWGMSSAPLMWTQLVPWEPPQPGPCLPPPLSPVPSQANAWHKEGTGSVC